MVIQLAIQLENANFANYYGRIQNQPTTGQGTIEIRVNPINQGAVKVTLPANQVSFVQNSQTLANIEAVYSFIYDTIAPTFDGYSDLVNTSTINIGGTAPLPSITGLCVDANFSSNRDAVRGTTTAIDTSTAGTYTNTYTCTDDAGNDATLSIAYVVAESIIGTTIASPDAVTVDGVNHVPHKSFVEIRFTFDQLVDMEQGLIKLTNAAFVSSPTPFKERNTDTPESGHTQIIFRLVPANDGVVSVELPARSVTLNSNHNLATSYSFTYDSKTPAPRFTTLSTTVASSPVIIAGTAESSSTVELFKGSTSITTTTTADSPSEAFRFTGVELVEGVNRFTAKATDVSGNISDLSSVLTITLETPPPPQKNKAYFTPFTDNLTNRDAFQHTIYADGLVLSQLSASDFTLSSGSILTAVNSNNNHNIAVVVQNAVEGENTITVNNEAISYLDGSTNVAFSYTYTVDRTAPVITYTGDNPASILIDGAIPQPQCTDNHDSTIVAEYNKNNIDVSTVGTYTLTYTCSDRAGNDATPVDVKFNVVASLPPVPVTIEFTSVPYTRTLTTNVDVFIFKSSS